MSRWVGRGLVRRAHLVDGGGCGSRVHFWWLVCTVWSHWVHRQLIHVGRSRKHLVKTRVGYQTTSTIVENGIQIKDRSATRPC